MSETRCYARLRVGDVVVLNSGGPDMRVVEIRNDRCLCQWGSGKNWYGTVLPNICVTKQ